MVALRWVLVLVAVFLINESYQQKDDLIIPTKNGYVKGQYTSWVFNEGKEWLGIPYATPPLGPLRFQPTQPLTSTWSGTRDATAYAPDCHQNGVPTSSEDCLYLNVYAPSNATDMSQLPVMVFLYGGSWISGGTSQAYFPIYTGAYLLEAGKQVILVTLNYRLGPLGFLGSPVLAANSTDRSTGNYGLQDQREALKWVKANIINFGGNPENILLFGESAGAGSVSNHLVLEKSCGLFNYALMESGPFAHWTARPLSVANTQFERLAKGLQCSGNNDQILECLRSKTAAELTSIHVSVPEYFTEWSPTIDGVELLDNPQKLAEKGQFCSVPTLLGTNLNEGTMFAGNVSKTMNETEYADYLVYRYGPWSTDLLKYYPASNYKSPWHAAAAIITDGDMVCPARRTARWLTTKNQQGKSSEVFLYSFNHVISEIAIFEPDYGVFHGSELLFVFDLPSWVYNDIPIVWTDSERVLAKRFGDYWTQFAANGNPTNSNSPSWPTYTNQTDTLLVLDLKIQPTAGWKKNLCDWWDTVYQTLN